MKENETRDGKRSRRVSTGKSTAKSVLNSLDESGFSKDNVNPLMSYDTSKKYFSCDVDEIGTKAAEGAGKESASVGVIAGIGTSLANIIL